MYDRKQISLCVLIALLTSIYSSSQEPVPDAADSARQKIASLTTSAAQELDADHLAKGNQFVEQILLLAKTNHLGNDPVFEQSMGVVMIAAMKSKGTNFLERALQIAETDTGDNATKLVCTYLGMVTQAGKQPATALRALQALSKAHPECQAQIEPFQESSLATAGIQKGDYTATEHLDAPKELAAKQISTLTAQAQRLFEEGEDPKGRRLFSEILRIADQNHLGTEQNFTNAYISLLSDAAGDSVQRRQEYLAQIFTISTRDGASPESMAALCARIANSVGSNSPDPEKRLQALDLAAPKYPVCASQFADIRKVAASSQAMTAAVKGNVSKSSACQTRI